MCACLHYLVFSFHSHRSYITEILSKKKGISIVGVQADEVAIPLVVMEEREKGKGQRQSMPVHHSLWPGKEVEVLTKTSLGIQG